MDAGRAKAVSQSPPPWDLFTHGVLAGPKRFPTPLGWASDLRDVAQTLPIKPRWPTTEPFKPKLEKSKTCTVNNNFAVATLAFSLRQQRKHHVGILASPKLSPLRQGM